MKLDRGTPEWHEELLKLPLLLEAWKQAPESEELIAAVSESLEKLGLIVPAV